MASYASQETSKERSKEQEVSKHIVLVLEGTNLLDLHEIQWPPLYAYEERADIDVSGYRVIPVPIKPLEEGLDRLALLDYVRRCHVSTASAWLKTLDAVWRYDRVMMSSPVIKLVKEYANHMYEKILDTMARWPFMMAMGNVGTEVRLTITNELYTPQTTPDNL